MSRPIHNYSPKLMLFISSKKGVLITLRKSLQLLGDTEVADLEPALALSNEKCVYRSNRPPLVRRIKACLKQIVGEVFTGLRNNNREQEVIRLLAEEGRKCRINPRWTQARNGRNFERGVEKIFTALKQILSPKFVILSNAILGRLFDKSVSLEWNFRKNHCQAFCNALISRSTFGKFIATRPNCQVCVPHDPLYLVSFVCGNSSGNYPRKVNPRTKRTVPNGLTEEYLLRYKKFGHHNESDVFDTLTEYWTDWGAFQGPIFAHQDLFPWDCTEALGGGAVGGSGSPKCNNCSVLQHVWAFPFDSWSLTKLHLLRERALYPANLEGSQTLSDEEWFSNRVRTLLALHSLNTVAVAMAKTKRFRALCRWIPGVIQRPMQINQMRLQRRDRRPKSQYDYFHRLQKGDPASGKKDSHLAEKQSKLAEMYSIGRSRLGGIYRGQPQSHLFEQSKLHDCTLAPWADLVRSNQIKAYIRLRDYRADVLTKVPELKSNSMSQRSGRTNSRAPQGNSNSWRANDSYYDPAYLDSGLDIDNSLSVDTSQIFDAWPSSDSDSDYDYDMDIADNAEDSYDGLDQFGDYLEDDFATMTADGHDCERESSSNQHTSDPSGINPLSPSSGFCLQCNR